MPFILLNVYHIEKYILKGSNEFVLTPHMRTADPVYEVFFSLIFRILDIGQSPKT
jgi:hypothetical protein